MTYYIKTTADGVVIICESAGTLVSFFDPSPGNSDWESYQKWLAEGNTPEPWPPASSST